jgi:hypothetical protein
MRTFVIHLNSSVKNRSRENVHVCCRHDLASFSTSGAGTEPDVPLFIDSSGDLIGATTVFTAGAPTDIGATYELAKIAGGYAPTFLADIPAGVNKLVNVPNLSADASGDLFGLEITGGANSLGAVVEFPVGGDSAITLANFDGSGASNPAGTTPVDASGNLFGTTFPSGSPSVVFELKKTGGA